MSVYKTLLVEDRAAARILTLNQPAIFNPADEVSAPEFIDALERAERDQSVRVVVVTGAGKAFSAGGNVRKMFETLEAGQQLSLYLMGLAANLHRSIATIRRMPKPVICAMNGITAGGGLGWALSCDLVVAAASAKLDPGYVRIALSPDGGSTGLLSRALGLQRANEFFMLGRVLDAEKAQALGLVNKVVPDGEALEAALEWAQELARGPAAALAATKRLLNQAVLGDLETIMENERQSICAMSDLPDAREGITAFIEKRKPDFSG